MSLWALLIYVTWIGRVGVGAEQCLPETALNRWLLGETIIGGLCNQLFGVYSIIPTARLLKADGVIIGPMHSRYDNFEIDYKVFVMLYAESYHVHFALA
jgi:hypothetical protein